MNVKKAITSIVIVVVTLVALDLTLGYLSGVYMNSRTLPGDYEMTDHVLRGFDDDIVVLGSSVALNSINTKTIEDSLGVKTFNGAANGQSFTYYLTMLKAIVDQKVPRTVILGLTPNNLTDTGAGSRYNLLAPYYGKGIADIDDRMHNGDTMERLLLKSNLYRLNRIWFRIMLYHFMSSGIKGENGFVAKPLPPAFPERDNTDADVAISRERREQFEEFTRICRDNNIELIVTMPPRYIDPYVTEPEVNRQAREICIAQGVRFYDDTFMPPFDTRNDLFYDTHHININGSVIFTDSIISRLR